MDKFADFDIYGTTYKVEDSTAVSVDVLVPKRLETTEAHPTIVRFHGGGFVSGSSLHPDFFPRWLLDLSAAHGALIVCPNYRLLPESGGLDIMDDLDDVWSWLHAPSGLQGLLASCGGRDGLRADLSRIMAVGESAGGYLGVQFALDHASSIRACVAACPALDIKALCRAGAAHDDDDDSGLALADQAIESYTTSAPVASDPQLTRLPLSALLMRRGVFLKHFDPSTDDATPQPPTSTRLYPMERLQQTSPAITNGNCSGSDTPRRAPPMPPIPPLFIIHGTADAVVPAVGSQAFVKALLDRHPGARVHLELRPGGHLMDVRLGREHAWLEEGLGLVVPPWLEGGERGGGRGAGGGSGGSGGWTEGRERGER